MSETRDWLAAKKRHLWILPALIFLLVAAGTLSPGSYFLHHDTPTQDVAAADLVNGCWTYTAATLAPMVLLSIPFAVFGFNPVWEMVILAVLGAVMTIAAYRLLVTFTRSCRWGVLGALWFISLPVILYYTRMHLGYPLAFFTLGVMLHAERRYTWAGVALGLAFTSHFNYVIPVAAWLGWAFLLDKETRRFSSLWRLAFGLLAPLLVLETARFFYYGIPFGWLRAEIEDALRLAGQGAADAGWSVMHLLRIIAFSNGWFNLLLLLVGLVYPVFRKYRVPLLDAVYLAGWSLIAYYTLQVSLLKNTFLTPRMFSGAYPLIVIAAVVALWEITRWLKAHKQKWVRTAGQVGLALIVMVGLPVSLLNISLEALAGSQTALVNLEGVAASAAEAGLPVRYFGNPHTGTFIGQRYEIPVSINETSLDIISGDTRAVLIFEDAEERQAAIVYDFRIDPADYLITEYEHWASYRPASAERYNLSPNSLASLSQQVFEPSQDAPRAVLSVWWPRDPQGTFEARTDREAYIYFYDGGCSIPRRFIGPDGERLNYYHMLWDKAEVIWQRVKAGDFAGIGSLLRQWIEN